MAPNFFHFFVDSTQTFYLGDKAFYHYYIKFSTSNRVCIVQEDQAEAQSCNINLLSSGVHMFRDEQYDRSKKS